MFCEDVYSKEIRKRKGLIYKIFLLAGIWAYNGGRGYKRGAGKQAFTGILRYVMVLTWFGNNSATMH